MKKYIKINENAYCADEVFQYEIVIKDNDNTILEKRIFTIPNDEELISIEIVKKYRETLNSFKDISEYLLKELNNGVIEDYYISGDIQNFNGWLSAWIDRYKDDGLNADEFIKLYDILLRFE